MADEIRKVLNLSLGESPKNVRELKQDINELKTAIGDMVVAGQTGTTAYDNAVKLLGEDLRTLNTVQNATKKEVDALDGSYNALVQKMRELKAEWRATNNEARRSELTSQIKTINDQLKGFDASIGNFSRNVGNYNSVWEGLSQTLNTTQQAGSQFVSGLNAMSGALGLTATQSEELNTSLGVMRGAVGALSGAKGIMSLVSSLISQKKATKEASTASKEETATLKLQKNATDGVTASSTLAAGAVKVLKIALASLGIGLIVAGITELITVLTTGTGWLTKFAEKLKIINPENQKLKKSNDLLNESIEANNKQTSDKVELLRAQGAAQKEILAEQLKGIKTNIEEARSAQALLKTKIDDLELTGKKKNLLKKLREEYEKNKETIADLEHKLAVTEAEIATDEKKTQEARVAAAKKANDDRKKEEDKAAEALKQAREKAEATVTSIMEKGMTAREKLTKEHNETLKNLEVAKAHITAEAYAKAVEEENKYYAEQLAGLLSEEYSKAYEKATEKLNNSLKGVKLDKKIPDIFKEAFGNVSFDGEWLDRQKALDGVRDYYKTIQLTALNEIKKFKDDLNAEAQGLLPSDLINPEVQNQQIKKYEGYYREYLKDSEAFLKKYGEPFTTTIKKMGENYDAFVDTYTEGLFRVMESYDNRLQQLKDEGRINEALTLLDEVRAQFSQRVGEVSDEAAEMWNNKWTQFETSFKASLTENWSGSTMALVAFTKDAFFNALAEIEAELDALKGKTEKTAEDLDKIASLESDKQRLLKQQHLEVWDAKTKAIIKYATTTNSMLESVASAWQNIIKAQVDAGNMTEEQAEKSFEAMKWLQYGVAVINTAAAFTQALVDPTIPDFYVRLANAAAALAAGTAQVASIYATHYQKQGSSATSTPTLVDRSPVTQTVSLNASEVGESATQNMRVYVVESDITDAQNRTKARVSESTF